MINWIAPEKVVLRESEKSETVSLSSDCPSLMSISGKLPAGSNAIGAILDGFPDSIVAKNRSGETIPAGTEVICQLISSRDKPGDPPADPAPESWRDRPPLL